MLLQSYTGVVKVFPSVPGTWKEVSFSNLRAVGAFLVSANRVAGRVERIVIESETGTVPVVTCPWAGRSGALDSEEMRALMDIRRDGNRWVLTEGKAVSQ